jgi:uncharacterized protein (DUF849 family)
LLKDKRIITVAPTGAWTPRDKAPGIPITPAEIAEEVYACWRAGAAVAHIHCRDDDGLATMDFDKYEEVVGLIRAHADCDIILELTTSGGVDLDEASRFRAFYELRPEMASYNCGSMNWQNVSILENSPAFLEKLGLMMQEVDVKPDVEVFDTGMLYNAGYYLKKGVLKAPLHFQFCMGVSGGIKATTRNLIFMKEIMDEVAPGSTWSAFGVGAGSMEIMLATIALGGDVRVGMEDNILYKKGQVAASNVEFVSRARQLIEGFGAEVATPDEARNKMFT